MNLSGGDGLRARLEGLGKTGPSVVNGALLDLGQELLRTAQGEAPRDTGDLVESGYVEETAPGVVTVGFRSEHAAAVHERLDVAHASGSAKFLERPQLELGAELPDRLAGAVKAAL